ncbi:MAG: hypothetical protein FWE10_08540 [Rikenellaceae bacterium]|nr:hypothetical protein [Rikenellaceae bacterium]MCL2692121.1 hypothetical protein [Rikenellaceae bacterium]
MRIRNFILGAFVLTLVPVSGKAQSSSINTFSPFTFYGLGDFHVQGPSNLRAMGGATAGYRRFIEPNGVINYTNPAALSATPRKTFHFNFGMEGSNHYLRTEDGQKTSFNTFNIRDVAFQTPLYEQLAFGFSLTPLSSVGYRAQIDETDPRVLEHLYEGGAIGAKYLYNGGGDVNQTKFSLGWEPLKRLSVGVDMIYYFGRIDRTFSTDILTQTSDAGFVGSHVTQAERISRIMWNFGVQYNLINNNYRQLTFGAMYSLGGRLNPEISTTLVNSLSMVQTINNGLADNFELPAMLTAGLSYRTWRLAAGLDYNYQGWGGLNPDSQIDGAGGSVSMKFRDVNSLRGGFEYTPDRWDVRRAWRRNTYRAGVRYGDYYMTFNDKAIRDIGVSIGLGMPIRQELRSHIDLGFEWGQRGTMRAGLIRENYFKVWIGLRLFGTDGWFQKFEFR